MTDLEFFVRSKCHGLPISHSRGKSVRLNIITQTKKRGRMWSCNKSLDLLPKGHNLKGNYILLWNNEELEHPSIK